MRIAFDTNFQPGQIVYYYSYEENEIHKDQIRELHVVTHGVRCISPKGESVELTHVISYYLKSLQGSFTDKSLYDNYDECMKHAMTHIKLREHA